MRAYLSTVDVEKVEALLALLDSAETAEQKAASKEIPRFHGWIYAACASALSHVLITVARYFLPSWTWLAWLYLPGAGVTLASFFVVIWRTVGKDTVTLFRPWTEVFATTKARTIADAALLRELASHDEVALRVVSTTWIREAERRMSRNKQVGVFLAGVGVTSAAGNAWLKIDERWWTQASVWVVIGAMFFFASMTWRPEAIRRWGMLLADEVDSRGSGRSKTKSESDD